MKFNSFSGTVLLLSAMAPAISAQSAPADIVASDEKAGSTRAAVPAPVASTPPVTPIVTAQINVRDMEVADLLQLISEQFNVPLVIAGDVTGKLPYVNLTNKTPEAAIQAVVNAANLKYRKQEDGTFLVGKTLPEEAPSIAPPIAPDNKGFDASLPPLSNSDFATPHVDDIAIPQLSGITPTSERKRTHVIRVRNVPPNVMAYWLDPANNEAPPQFKVAAGNVANYGNRAVASNALGSADQTLNDNGANPTAAFSGTNPNYNPYTSRSNAEIRSFPQVGGNPRGGGAGGAAAAAATTFDRPAGVDRIAAIDAQNVLLVFGTDDGVRELQEIISLLDRPLRQVEIEAQFVTVSTSDSRSFGIDYTATRNNFTASSVGNTGGGLTVSYVGANFSATLTALLNRNRAKVITAPRVTAINNLTAELISQTSSPLILTVTNNIVNNNTTTQAVTQRLIYITTNIGLTVTPTINNDDTVTVLMQPELESQTPAGLLGNPSIPLITSQRVRTTANVRDGETIALGGLRSAQTSRGQNKIPLLGDLPLVGVFFRSRNVTDNDSELIIFLTARIVRRAGDDDVVPGT